MATLSGAPNYSCLFINLFERFVNMFDFAISFKPYVISSLILGFRYLRFASCYLS